MGFITLVMLDITELETLREFIPLLLSSKKESSTCLFSIFVSYNPLIFISNTFLAPTSELLM